MQAIQAHNQDVHAGWRQCALVRARLPGSVNYSDVRLNNTELDLMEPCVLICIL